MIISVPFEENGEVVEKQFSTDDVLVTEENINERAQALAQLYSCWSCVYAQYRRKLLLLEAKHAKWIAQVKQIVIDATKVKYNSETAKMDAVLTYQDPSGNYVYAEEELRYNNKRAELLYYIDLVEGSILKALTMEKDMIVSLGAQMRAGYSATTAKIG